jgi:hypothetical protein
LLLFLALDCFADGCDPNLSYSGVTPLQMAIECGAADIAAVLLHWNANPNAPTASRARGAGWRTGESAVMMCNRYIKENKPNDQKQVDAAKQVDLLLKNCMELKDIIHGSLNTFFPISVGLAIKDLTATFPFTNQLFTNFLDEIIESKNLVIPFSNNFLSIDGQSCRI